MAFIHMLRPFILKVFENLLLRANIKAKSVKFSAVPKQVVSIQQQFGTAGFGDSRYMEF